MRMNIADLRIDYQRASLSESDVAASPLEQFASWFDQAIKAEVPEANAMTLATVTADGQPSARIVLLKGVDESGFTFFTNYQSRKGRELAENDRAALLFFWPALERQIRIEGDVSLVSTDESDTYFASRPLGSRLGAWASPQSTEIASREQLDQRLLEITTQFGESPPRPANWGGYRLVPRAMEFWQGRSSRLHDRVCYARQTNGWRTFRLAP
jgi:pyridoxamine 5'-phosphate oxidase